MERSTDNYLHKKFKKQLSLEPRSGNAAVRNDDKENKIGQTVVEEDNNKTTVPNYSTNNHHLNHHNHHHPHHHHHNNNNSSNTNNNQTLTTSVPAAAAVVLVGAATTKSSISIESEPCISTGDAQPDDDDDPIAQTSFEATSNSGDPSAVSSSNNEHYNQNGHLPDATPKHEEATVQIVPEKNANGKYVCHYCNLVCSKPSVLQKHIRAHTNERPFPCKSCGFSFKTRSNLYKHCRSRTHANRVMGVKAQQQENVATAGDSPEDKRNCAENATQTTTQQQQNYESDGPTTTTTTAVVASQQNKPYKPRFHSSSTSGNSANVVDVEDDRAFSGSDLSHHINEIINKNNSIVNSAESSLLKRRFSETLADDTAQRSAEEPLNLTNKNRKRCMSEAATVVEPTVQKSLIKELLIKNLYSDLQCVYCKMIFGTVTELELHKLRNCKAKSSDAKHTRSNSVNVASILTKNKNAFDSMPQFQNMMFPLNSPGPFLGKTRLVESDKSKSFSFDAVNIPIPNAGEPSTSAAAAAYTAMSPLSFREERKTPVRLFGGEVKVQDSSGETKSYRIDQSTNDGTVSENRVVKSNLQSGGTVVLSTKTTTATNPFGYEPDDTESPPARLMLSPPIKYPNLTDISMKLLTPKIKPPSLYSIRESSSPPTPKPPPPVVPVSSRTNLPALNISVEPTEAATTILPLKKSVIQKTGTINNNNVICNPMNLLVNGKVIRYVPGMPGPVVAAADDYAGNIVAVGRREALSPMPPPVSLSSPRAIQKQPPTPNVADKASSPPETPPKSQMMMMDSAMANEPTTTTTKKFVRPTSLALRPTTAASKQHHGLTPTVLTQILISPDTPRVAKKYAQHLFNGNYFSYLGLKSSTKFVYCTLNKTQPFYVPHFKKLSMYSEWRQQDTKTDKLYVSAYDSKQRNQRYTSAGKATADLIMHSSYKFAVSEGSSKSENEDDTSKSNSLIGGYKCSEDSPYVRGRGRGRYVCEQCGIRCKKPSMLKKHIRTHSNDRPYTCSHCNFSFKTKGNLTKHMKSKSHSKNYTATGSGSGSSTRMSGSQSSDYDTDDSGMDSSDESMTRLQEHEAAYGLLSLSQKTSVSTITTPAGELMSPSGIIRTDSPASSTDQFMTSEEIAYVSKTNYAKNKILDSRKFKPNKEIAEQITTSSSSAAGVVEAQFDNKEEENLNTYLGKTSTSRPLTYPYTSALTSTRLADEAIESPQKVVAMKEVVEQQQQQPDPIRQFHVIQKYGNLRDERTPEKMDKIGGTNHLPSPIPMLKVNDVVVMQEEKMERKRKITVIENNYKPKVHRNDEVMDLSISSGEKWSRSNRFADYRNSSAEEENRQVEELNYRNLELNRKLVQPLQQLQQPQQQQQLHQPVASPLYHYNIETLVYNPQEPEVHSSSSNETRPMEYDNSAMETLAEVATKQVKLDKNTLAKSVATEYLKLATQNENLDGNREATTNVVNDLIVKPEGSKSCALCSKSFTKPFQLKLHMNIHYLERPFRCDSCSVSFRTKGHLQKHERSASHYSKLSSSPAQPSTEPRPFKCMDCNIAFRIHGHLAKHLRSKMHIMKLECLAKIPFGLYAELERSNSLLTEINTSDGDQCLESLKTLAKKVFVNDPGKLQVLLNEADPGSNFDTDNT